MREREPIARDVLAESLAECPERGLIFRREKLQPSFDREFFQSALRAKNLRAKLLHALIADQSPGYRDAALWSQIAETPFEDLRLKFVDHLALREKRPDADKLAPIWCAVLLGVHRGGRQKAKAVRQIADAISDEPTRAASLLPVLAVAIRSVRGPEMRAGLAAVMSLIARRPELAARVREKLPELRFSSEEVAA